LFLKTENKEARLAKIMKNWRIESRPMASDTYDYEQGDAA
jgi:hypothetical protein